MLLEKLKQWVVLTHKIERQFKEGKALKVDVNKNPTFLYNSPRLQVACNEIEKARMAAGDLVRLVILGKESRGNVRFIPAEHGCISTQKFVFPPEEADLIKSMKNEIRELIYSIFDSNNNDTIEGTFDLYEFVFYKDRLLLALYDCDRALGLRLGDIYSNG